MGWFQTINRNVCFFSIYVNGKELGVPLNDLIRSVVGLLKWCFDGVVSYENVAGFLNVWMHKNLRFGVIGVWYWSQKVDLLL